MSTSAGLEIIFEDEHCLAVVKPAGQFTQGKWAPEGEVTLEHAVRIHLCPGNPESAYVGIVHRLDRPVSGLLLWAKTKKAARRLSAQFERKQVEKEYWAITECPDSSCPVPQSSDEVIWTDWLTSAGVAGVVRIVEPGAAGSRPATTRSRVARAISLPPGSCWLRLWPQTGRTHQLRVQASSRGYPILGDSTYGSRIEFETGPTIALHAHRLVIRHPVLQTPMTLSAPPPGFWRNRRIVLPSIEGVEG